MANDYLKVPYRPKLIDNKYIGAVGHPGDSITIRMLGNGNIVAYETPRYWTHQKIVEYGNVLKIKQQEAGFEPAVGWPAGSGDWWHEWWYYKYVPRKMLPFGISP